MAIIINIKRETKRIQQLQAFGCDTISYAREIAGRASEAGMLMDIDDLLGGIGEDSDGFDIVDVDLIKIWH